MAKAQYSLLARFLPGLAARRLRARIHYEQMAAVYKAARSRHGDPDWIRSSVTGDASLADLPILLARARAATRDAPLARALKRSMVRNVVGRGITIRSTANLANGDAATDFRDAIRRVHRRWSVKQFCDVEQRRSWRRVQKWVAGEITEAGEALVRLVQVVEPGRPIRLALQLIEAEQLATDMFTAMNSVRPIRAGVELGEWGRPVAYHVRLRDSADTSYSAALKTTRIPAEQILHIFDPERVLQARGITDLAPALNTIRDQSEMQSAVLWNARIDAAVGLIVKKGTRTPLTPMNAPPGSQTTDDAGNTNFEMRPGFIAEFGADDEVEPFSSNRPGTAYDPFMRLCERQASAATGQTIEQATGDFTQGSYSSQTLGRSENKRSWRDMQELLIEDLCRPVWRALVVQAVLESMGTGDELDQATPEDFWQRVDDYADCVAVPDAWERIDSKKESAADSSDVQSRFRAIGHIIEQTGQTVEEVADRMARDIEIFDAAGLPNPYQSQQPAPTESSDAPDDDVDEDKDDE
jgi:lambda family phage portal protein